MGKLKNNIYTVGLRTGNTIATPFRRTGEIANAAANILRQGQSSAKNTAEVGKQTIDALVDNFTNFSKVDGKRYQRLTKGTINLASAVTRRPFMIAGAGIASGINQGIWQPFKKLLYTPGKMFKGIRNATRIFSKKKGFDFVTYDTHETGGDTRVNKIKEKRIGFVGKASVSKSEEKVEKVVKEEKKPKEKKEESKQEKPAEQPKAIEKLKEDPNTESKELQKAIKNKDDATIDKELAERGYGHGGTLLDDSKKSSDAPKDTPKSIDDVKKQRATESQAKKNAEIEAKKRKNLSKEDKDKHRKEFEKLLGNNFTEEGVLARAKKNNKGNNLEQVLKTLDKENVTFATFIDDEILAKKIPAKAKTN